MGQWWPALIVAMFVAFALAIVIVRSLRGRRHNVVSGYEHKIADLDTSFDMITAARVALDVGDAERALELGLRVEERHTVGAFSVTETHALIGEAALNVGAVRTAAEFLPTAVTTSQRNSVSEANARLLRMLATAKLQLCEVDEAVDAARMAYHAAEDNTGRAAALQLEAAALIAQGNASAARDSVGLATKLTDRPETSAQIERLLGKIDAIEGKLDEARVHLERAKTLASANGAQPDVASILGDLADSYELAGDRTHAVDLWRQAVKRSDDEPARHATRAVLAARLATAEAAVGEIEPARAHLDEARTQFDRCQLPSAPVFTSWAEARIAAATNDASATKAWDRALREAKTLEMVSWKERIKIDRKAAEHRPGQEAS